VLLHVVARNRCIACGSATVFEHPRTGELINRSEEVVQALAEKLLDLRERGGEIVAQQGYGLPIASPQGIDAPQSLHQTRHATPLRFWCENFRHDRPSRPSRPAPSSRAR
jgi:hypothetical protein